MQENFENLKNDENRIAEFCKNYFSRFEMDDLTALPYSFEILECKI